MYINVDFQTNMLFRFLMIKSTCLHSIKMKQLHLKSFTYLHNNKFEQARDLLLNASINKLQNTNEHFSCILSSKVSYIEIIHFK